MIVFNVKFVQKENFLNILIACQIKITMLGTYYVWICLAYIYTYIHTVSYGGASCALLITDAASKFSRAYTLVHKSDVFECLKSFIPWFERQSGVNIKAFRCDNGGEFVNRKATELMKEKGIVLQLTVAYNPQQNGRAEVMNRHYSEMVRSMLGNAGLPNEFWAEALMHATFIKNRTIRKDQKESPVKMRFGKEENLSRIKVFGCKVEYLIPKEKRNKLEEKTRTGIYLGTSDSCYPDYSNSTKHAYRLFDLESCEVMQEMLRFLKMFFRLFLKHY